MTPPLDYKVRRPFEYVSANSTDIRKTFERVRAELAKRAPVVPIKKETA